MMTVTNQDCIRACQGYLHHFYERHPDAALQKRAMKALRLLTACDETLGGKPAGWAAGIVYAVANRERGACGVPGILNREFEAFFDVSMGTARKRSAQLARLLDW
jgi:hypothetical protein